MPEQFFLRGSDSIAPASLDSPALSAQESGRFALHCHRYGIASERRNWGTGRLTGRDGARPDSILIPLGFDRFYIFKGEVKCMCAGLRLSSMGVATAPSRGDGRPQP